MRLTNRGGCRRPAWSPDSQSIAFVSTQENEDGIPESFLYFMNAEGKRVRQLADTSSGVCTWSSDGKEIAFIPPGDAIGGRALFSVDTDGRNMRQLTRLYKGFETISGPVWWPSEKWIAYVLVQLPEIIPGEGVPANEFFANSVICVANTADIGGDEPLEATRKLVSGSSLQWVPAGFLSVFPSAEKQITFWGVLKQMEDAAK